MALETGVVVATYAFFRRMFTNQNHVEILEQTQARDENNRRQREKELEETNRRHEESLNTSYDNLDKQIKATENINKTNLEYDEKKSKRNEKLSISPFRMPYDDIEEITDKNKLRIFIRHPQNLTIWGDVRGTVWNETHANNLNNLLSQKIAKYYADRAQYFSHDIFNPLGLKSGEITLPVLQKEMPGAASIWIQADRVDFYNTALGMGCWGGDFGGYDYKPLGTVPNYQQSLHDKRTMALSMFFNESELGGNISGAEEELEKAEQELQQSIQNDNTNQIATAAIEHLTDAYLLLAAISLDGYFLKYGMMPKLPNMIRSGDIGIDAKYMQAAMANLLAEYSKTALTLAQQYPQQGHIIWLGMADFFSSLDDAEAVKESLARSIDHYKKLDKASQGQMKTYMADLLKLVDKFELNEDFLTKLHMSGNTHYPTLDELI